MKIWEIEGERYPMYGERRGGRSYGGSYNQHDSAYSEGFEDGCEEGYRKAMSHIYGQRTIHRGGEGLSRMYMRGGDEWDDEMDMRRRRDSRGRYM